jgi:hypothetical protein
LFGAVRKKEATKKRKRKAKQKKKKNKSEFTESHVDLWSSSDVELHRRTKSKACNAIGCEDMNKAGN